MKGLPLTLTPAPSRPPGSGTGRGGSIVCALLALTASMAPAQRGANGPVRDPSISDDGRFVAFDTDATDLVAGSGTTNANVGFFDRQTRRIYNAQWYGQGSAWGGALFPQLSRDGNWITFQSSNSLLPDRTTTDVYVAAVRGQTIGLAPASKFKRISRNAAGTAGNGVSNYPAISADGRFVTYMSRATNLTSDIVNGTHTQIFRHDRDADADGVFDENGLGETATVLVSKSAGAVGNNSSTFPSISADGLTVLFFTTASNLPGTTSAAARIWRDGVVSPSSGARRGLVPEGTQTVDSSRIYVAGNTSATSTFFRYRTGGTQTFPSGDFTPAGNAVSSGGRFILTTSIAPVVSADTNTFRDLYLIDRQEKFTSLISTGPNGVGNGVSGPSDANDAFLDMSRDGRFIAYVTRATNLGFNDANGDSFDVIILDRQTGVLDRIETDITAPVWTAPASLTATQITPQSALLTWTPASDAGGIGWYTVDYNDGSLERSFVYDQSTSKVLDGLKPSTTYNLTMTASDPTGNKTRGPSTTFTTPADPAPSTDFAITAFSPGPTTAVTFRSQPGRTYTLQYSGDLISWLPLASNIASQGSLTYTVAATPATLPQPHWIRVKEN